MNSQKLQTEAQHILDYYVSDKNELGLQLAVYHKGELVINAAAGISDRKIGDHVTTQTLFPVFSVSKGITAAVIHLLAQRGTIDYDKTIASYWPEFGVNGKESITVREVLNHSAGIPHMPSRIGFAELCDWETMCKKIAALAPLWEPGTQVEYHAMTFGWILGEVAHRADGRPFPKLLESLILEPLQIHDLFIGIPEGVDNRIATLENFLDQPAPVPTSAPESIPSWMGSLYNIMNRADLRRACIPATTGIMTAEALARFYASHLKNGAYGKRLITEEQLSLALTPQRPRNPIGDYNKNWGLGYTRDCSPEFTERGFSVFGHSGYGGSIGFAVPQLDLAIGFAKNLLNRDGINGAIYRFLVDQFVNA